MSEVASTGGLEYLRAEKGMSAFTKNNIVSLYLQTAFSLINVNSSMNLKDPNHFLGSKPPFLSDEDVFTGFLYSFAITSFYW